MMRGVKKYLPLILLLVLSMTVLPVYAAGNSGGQAVSGSEDADLPEEGSGRLYFVDQNSGHQLVIEDDAHLLSTIEINALKIDMEPILAYGHAVFKTISDNPMGDAYSFGADYYYSHLGNETGSLLLIDMDTRQIYVISGGKNFDIITESKSDSITDNIYRYASKGQYYFCAKEAFEEIRTLLEGNRIAEPMKVISNVLIAVLAAMFLNFIIVHRSVRLKAPSRTEIDRAINAYARAGQLNVTHVSQSKRYDPIQSTVVVTGGGGGGGGGHSSGGGGGGFSGGGGGHSF